MVFPEVDYDMVEGARGLNISIQTTAQSGLIMLVRCLSISICRLKKQHQQQNNWVVEAWQEKH